MIFPNIRKCHPSLHFDSSFLKAHKRTYFRTKGGDSPATEKVKKNLLMERDKQKKNILLKEKRKESATLSLSFCVG